MNPLWLKRCELALALTGCGFLFGLAVIVLVLASNGVATAVYDSWLKPHACKAADEYMRRPW